MITRFPHADEIHRQGCKTSTLSLKPAQIAVNVKIIRLNILSVPNQFIYHLCIPEAINRPTVFCNTRLQWQRSSFLALVPVYLLTKSMTKSHLKGAVLPLQVAVLV